mmetsp:Transcript_13599/g.38957  ORF Transcript_13599/g.38957 Transcript_13599/m.38957 type:complete len:112 (+) Transcript_13599:451-786(+)
MGIFMSTAMGIEVDMEVGTRATTLTSMTTNIHIHIRMASWTIICIPTSTHILMASSRRRQIMTHPQTMAAVMNMIITMNMNTVMNIVMTITTVILTRTTTRTKTEPIIMVQ